MFDLGYLSVDTRYRLRVSSRLRTEFGNGEAFYAKEGTVITLHDRRRCQRHGSPRTLSAAPIRANIVKSAYGSGPVTTRAAELG
jgi:hypothetical protein